jgi:hypothetical protein
MSNGDAPPESDAGANSMAVPVAPPTPDRRTARRTYQRLRMAGLTASEAGNLTAHLSGLHVAEHGWTLREIERVLFVRALVELGRIAS